MSSKVEQFLTTEEEASVVGAIRTAENNTSGEIRVHLEKTALNKDVFDRAIEVFDLLHMNNTKQNNGVLIYVAVADRTLVIMGDTGINEKVPVNFWDSTKNAIISQFKMDDMAQGLVDGILIAGKQLKKHFPRDKDDVNELGDTISVG